MTIIFVTLDGERVKTQNVDRLFEAAREGKIAPTTIVEVDGKRVWAGKIKKLFPPGTQVPAGDPPPLKPASGGDSPPQNIRVALVFLLVLVVVDAIGGIAYGAYIAGASPAIGAVQFIRTIFSSSAYFAVLYVLNQIVTKIYK